MSSQHADIEAISAYVDGEAPEWTDHIAACPECRESAATLRAVAVAVGRPVDAPSAAARDRAVAAALDGASVSDGHDAERARFARRRRGPTRPWAMPAAAAAAVALLAASGVVLSSYRTSDETTTLAGPTPESDAHAPSLFESGDGVNAAAPTAPPGDLGDVPDAITLRARAIGPPAAAGSALSATDAAARNNLSPTTVLTPTTTLTQRAAPSVVGTRPCEEQARTREPSLGPVVYFATARKGAVGGVVLGFGAVGSTSTTPVTLLLLAQDGCGELLRAAGP